MTETNRFERQDGFPALRPSQRRFGVVYADIWGAPRFRLLTPTQRCVYVTLCVHASRSTGECWPRQKNIASTVGVTRRAVRAAIKKLRELGLIEVNRQPMGRKRINLYKLVWPPPTSLD